jgi:RND family efflux transporter MFP subunit
VGQSAQLTISNFPGRQFRGNITRTASALDPSSRTMLVEVDVSNSEGLLFPGMYAEVELSAPLLNPPLVVPASALIVRTDGAQVAVVQPDGTVHLQKVTIGRDYGDRLEILQGLREGATIVAVPGEAARDGIQIVPVSSEPVTP